jgi:hypothetical protein
LIRRADAAQFIERLAKELVEVLEPFDVLDQADDEEGELVDALGNVGPNQPSSSFTENRYPSGLR